MKTTLSIVIPTKDEEENLPDLFRSLQEQTRQPDEIIVADANSQDRTREIAQGFGARVVDGGLPGPGRNRGAEVATSDYLLFLDADVVLKDRTFLERSLDEIVERDLDFATVDVLPLDGNKVDEVFHNIYNGYCRLVSPVHKHAPGFCMFLRRSFHERLGGFDETVTFCEDHEYAQRAGRNGRFGFLSMPVPVSIRRFDRDGRLSIAVKYVLAELHHWIIGPIRHNKFNYTFGYKKKKDE